MYSKDDVRKSTLAYFRGDELATNIWIDKYALKNIEGEFLELSPIDMYKRISGEFARTESKYPNPIDYDEIYELISEGYILPGGSLLYGIGNAYSISSLGNCFVIGNGQDSYGGICSVDEEQAQLMKRRAGVGHDISHLRASNTKVTNSAGTSTGPVSFMPRYSNTTREVAQDGRRGALMLSMHVNHSDIEQFIMSKDDLTKITGANISVKVDDQFMENIQEYFDKEPKAVSKKCILDSKLWNKLVHQAWKSAEPGILFWDTITKESIPACYGDDWKEVSTNPCGEIPLCPYDSCRLMSINLTKFVKKPFTNHSVFDWVKLEYITRIAQRLMDDVVDLEEEKINKILNKIENDPEPEDIKLTEKNLWLKIRKKLLEGRRTGLSGIGLADTLAMLGLPYTGGISMAESMYKNIAISAYKSSIELAEERGAFPIWNFGVEKDNPFFKRIWRTTIPSYKVKWHDYGRRNIAILTIPPSGTISLLAGISSGIETVYQLSYKRRRKVNEDNPHKSFIDKNGDCWEEYDVLHPLFKEWINIVYDDQLQGIKAFEIDHYKTISPWKNSTAYEIDPINRVMMQAAIQKWVDHSISSTINLPSDITEEKVSEIFIEAWKQGCKGITIYRDGSRDGVLVSTTESDDFLPIDAPKRPKELECDIFYTTSKGVPYNVLVGLLKGKPYEVFATTDILSKDRHIKGNLIKVSRGHYKVNGDINREHLMENMSNEEKIITRAMSALLRHRAHVKFVVDTLYKLPGEDLHSFNKVLARVLKKYIKDDEIKTGATCDNCGSSDIIYKDGCEQCNSCGSSKCG